MVSEAYLIYIDKLVKMLSLSYRETEDINYYMPVLHIVPYIMEVWD